MLSGSAGEGVQVAAELLAKSAIISGLNSTKKGSYPVTVGVGFSSSEVIISPEPIKYTGFSSPEVIFITSQDGLDYAKATFAKMTENDTIYLDESLANPETKAQIVKRDFRNKAGGKFATIYALILYLNTSEIFPKEAFYEIFTQTMTNSKVDITKLLD
jgi:Pyruvate/2-oxoacid:ferredoxin oxidoreductase gamma subunit